MYTGVKTGKILLLRGFQDWYIHLFIIKYTTLISKLSIYTLKKYKQMLKTMLKTRMKKR